GGFVGVLDGADDVVGEQVCSDGATDDIHVIRGLVGRGPAAGLHGGHAQNIAVAVVAVLRDLVGRVGGRGVLRAIPGIDRLGFAAQKVVEVPAHDPARVNRVQHKPGGVVVGVVDQHGIGAGRHSGRAGPGGAAIGADIHAVG